MKKAALGGFLLHGLKAKGIKRIYMRGLSWDLRGWEAFLPVLK